MLITLHVITDLVFKKKPYEVSAITNPTLQMKKPKQRLSDLSRVTQLISGGISILGSLVPQLILGSEWERGVSRWNMGL